MKPFPVCSVILALLSILVVQTAVPEEEAPAPPAPTLSTPPPQTVPILPPADDENEPQGDPLVDPDNPKGPRDVDTVLTRKEIAKRGSGLHQLTKTDWGYSLWARLATGRITEVLVKDKSGKAQRLLREVIVHPPGPLLVPLRLTGKRPPLWVTRYQSKHVSSFKFLDALAREYVRVSILDNPGVEAPSGEWARAVELVWSFRDPVSDNGLVLRHVLPREQAVRFGTGLPGQVTKHGGKKNR